MILVFGSINIDVLIPVPHLPAPGETVLGGDYALAPGGKGANQALAARRAGAEVSMAGAVGEDAFAMPALELLVGEGVDLTLVHRVGRSTGCASVIVDAGGENLIAVGSGANALVRADQVPDAALGPDMVLVCQMEVPPGETAALIRRARDSGARTVLNLAPALLLPEELLPHIDVLVANRGEAVALGDPGGVARQLREALVVTKGADGATAFLADGSRIAVPALAVEPIDTTGAGDAFVGVLAAGLGQGLAFRPALHRASAAAGLACLARGAQPALPDRAAIEAALSRLPEPRHIPS